MLIKSFKVDRLSVKVYDSRESMGAEAAREAAVCLRDILSKKDEVNIVFAAAPSQNEFLAALSEAEGIAWGRVTALHMDEYVGLPEDAPQGFGNFLRRAIFDKVPFKEVFYIGSQLPKEEAVARYDKILSERHIDIVFMGIGENGHIAFNDPHVADFNDPLRIKEVDLDLKCRTQQVHDGCFKALEEVPEYALTLTCPVLFGADHLFCVVPAATKADAACAMLRGPVTEACPASILRRHEDATLYLDRDSGRLVLN